MSGILLLLLFAKTCVLLRMQSAVWAEPIELQQVILHAIAGMLFNPRNQRFNIATPRKFGSLATRLAHNGVVVARRGGQVAMATILKVNPPYKAHIHQQIEHTIDSDQTQAAVHLAGLLQDLLWRQGRIGMHHNRYHGPP
jgi:hypothetical protein